MLALIIETCTERSSIVIAKDDNLLFEKHLLIGYHQSKYLIPEIQSGLEKLAITPQELSCVAVGVGPGSYTGIRVGAMVAKTMTYALNIPLIGFCTLESFIPDNDGVFAILIDAKISGAYLLKGIKKGSEIKILSSPGVYSLEELTDHLEDVEVIVTPYQHFLQPKVEKSSSGKKWLEKGPDAWRMISIVLDKYKKQDVSLDGHLELMYLRKTQAEIEKELRQ